MGRAARWTVSGSLRGLTALSSQEAWDRIYVTTLFSFEYRKIGQAIDFALEVANGQSDKVFVGGIAASLMHDRFSGGTTLAGYTIHQRTADRAASGFSSIG